MKIVDTDPIVPARIEHRVEEMWDGDQLVQHYNYLDYHFEARGAYCRARVYFEMPREATLFGPFDGPESIAMVARPDFVNAVLAYLERRFEVRRR